MCSGFRIEFFNMIGESLAQFSKQNGRGDVLSPFFKG